MNVAPSSQAKPNGRVVLLLHGKNFSGAFWERTARTLSDQGFRVVIQDQIGFGKSSKPIDLHYSFAMMAAQTQALLAELSIKCSIVVGHSMGGMLASRYALRDSGGKCPCCQVDFER